LLKILGKQSNKIHQLSNATLEAMWKNSHVDETFKIEYEDLENQLGSSKAKWKEK